jgi:branched-chain amino acid aminotransferase
LNKSAEFINFNGSILPADQALLSSDNRSFRYGDGLFETMLVREGAVRLGNFHFERLFEGMRLLHLELPTDFTAANLERQVLELCAANAGNGGDAGDMGPAAGATGPAAGEAGHAMARLIIYRAGAVAAGAGAGAGSTPHYVIQAAPLGAAGGGWNEKGLVIDLFPDGRKSIDAFSGLKSNSYLLYIMAAIYAREHRLNDCLVLNHHDRVADCSIANLFYCKGDQIYTPPLSDGGVAGVMRRYLLESLPRAGYSVRERPMTPDDLLSADEVFLSNALKGINWVHSFGGVKYTNRLAGAIYQQVISKL